MAEHKRSRSEEVLKNGSFGKLLLNLSLPTVLVILIMIIYNVADTFFIGQLGDPNRIAAISLAMPLFSLLSGIGTLFGNGGTTSISLALGREDRSKVEKVTAFCLLGSLSVGLLYFAILTIFTEPIVIFLGADADTLALTMEYVRTYAYAAPFVMFSQVFAAIMRSDGDGAAAMIPNVVGTVSNIILDAFFILVLDLDVFGAALATVLGNVISTVLVIIMLVRKKQMFIPRMSKLSFESSVVVPVLTLGLPMTISTVLGSLGGTIQNRLVISYGANALAAQSVAGKVSLIITMLIMGVVMGLQPAISYTFGSKNYKRMYQIVKQTAIFTCLLGLGLTIVASIFKNAIVAAFIDNAEVIELGQVFVIAAVVVGPFYGIYQLCQTFLQSTGKVTYAIIASMLDKFIIFIPILYLLNYTVGLYGIAFGHAAALAVTIVVTLIMTKKWANDIAKMAKENS